MLLKVKVFGEWFILTEAQSSALIANGVKAGDELELVDFAELCEKKKR